MIVAIGVFVALGALGVIGFVWQRTRGRKMLAELQAQQAAGTARTWIDVTFPASTSATRANAFALRQRLCALALCGEVAAVAEETAAIEGDFLWKTIAVTGGLLGLAVKGDAASVAAQARALADAAPKELRGVARDVHAPALRAVSGLVDALAGTAPPPAHLIDLQKATAYQPFYRALAWEGMVKVCERAGDQRAVWMKEALARNALEA